MLRYANMPASREIALADKLNSRSKIGKAWTIVGGSVTGAAAGTFTDTSYVLPGARNTSLCTRGVPGSTLPSSAIRAKPDEGAGTVLVTLPVCAPTMDGTCMRRPAFTKRTSTVLGAAAVPCATVAGSVGNSDAAPLVLSKA